MLVMQQSKPSISCSVTSTLVTLTQGRQALTSRHSATNKIAVNLKRTSKCMQHISVSALQIPQAALTVSLAKAASISEVHRRTALYINPLNP
jgi:uncharacterized membrane protein